jgi:outer membrane protein TolC
VTPAAIVASLLLSQAAVPAAPPAPAATPAQSITKVVPPDGTAPAEPAAKSPVPRGKTLTLRQAIEAARAQNLDIAQLDAKVQAAKELTWKAWSAYIPWVQGSAGVVRNQTEIAFSLPTGQPPPNDYAMTTVQPLVQAQAQVKLTQAVIAPQAAIMIANSYKAEKTIDYTTQQARRDILFGVAQLYYGVASLQELYAVQERQLVLTQERERDARVRFEAGTGTKVGLLRAEIDRAQAEQDVLRSRIDFQRARLSLATALDRPDDFDIVIPESPKRPTGDNLEQQALDLRPDVKAAAEALALAEGERLRITMQYLPTIGVFGAYNYATTATFNPNPFFWQIGVGLTWNILDGGLREASIREASAKIAEADAQKRQVDLNATVRVKQAELDLQGAIANRAKARERTGLAQENARLVDVAYKAGAATYLESTDSVQTLRQAEVGLVAESLNVDLATLKLLNAVGAFEEVNR